MITITPEILLQAYATGIFPMAESRDDPTLHWIAPKMRGVLPLDSVHVPRRLARKIRQVPFVVRTDSAFGKVIRACAEPEPGRPDTWINDTIVELYSSLFETGHAHSVECWRDGRLVGGLYGITLGAAFFGESMFKRETDASKIALMNLVARLRFGGFKLLDMQFLTDHLKRFGAVEIPQKKYQEQLRRAVASSADFYSLPEDASAAAVLQLVTQTS
ncbi:MAG: leucyl/phenylalanyl-tRNA--protein transferase [Sphingomonadales bacterium]